MSGADPLLGIGPPRSKDAPKTPHAGAGREPGLGRTLSPGAGGWLLAFVGRGQPRLPLRRPWARRPCQRVVLRVLGEPRTGSSVPACDPWHGAAWHVAPGTDPASAACCSALQGRRGPGTRLQSSPGFSGTSLTFPFPATCPRPAVWLRRETPSLRSYRDVWAGRKAWFPWAFPAALGCNSFRWLRAA